MSIAHTFSEHGIFLLKNSSILVPPHCGVSENACAAFVLGRGNVLIV